VYGRNYTVVPSKEGYSFTPVVQVFNNLRGNQTANFKLLDTTPPVLILPSDITENASIPLGATVSYTVTATDNVTMNMIVTCNPTSGSLFPIGSTNVTCTVVDGAGNRANGTFKVTVKGAGAQLSDLIATANSFNLGQDFKKELEKAQTYLNQGDTPKACREIDKFIENVRKERDKGDLSLEQASLLTGNAIRIKSVMACS
jgi:hypothetical protein